MEEGISGGSRTRFQFDDEAPGTDGGMFNVREVDKDKVWSLDVVRLRFNESETNVGGLQITRSVW